MLEIEADRLLLEHNDNKGDKGEITCPCLLFPTLFSCISSLIVIKKGLFSHDSLNEDIIKMALSNYESLDKKLQNKVLCSDLAKKQ